MSDDYDEYLDRLVSPITGRPMYFNKDGEPISVRQFGELKFDITGNPDDYEITGYARIGADQIGDAWVSTVWLGIDHGWGLHSGTDDYRPVIFETMVFGGKYDEALRRYCTEDEARKGHREAVEDLRTGMAPWWAHGGVEDDEWRMHGE